MRDALRSHFYYSVKAATNYAGHITSMGWTVHEALCDIRQPELTCALDGFKEALGFEGTLEQFCKEYQSLGLSWDSDKKEACLVSLEDWPYEGYKNMNFQTMTERILIARFDEWLAKELPDIKPPKEG